MAAFVITGAILGLAYLGLLGFTHRFARTPGMYLLALMFLLVSAPVVAIIAFRVLPGIIVTLI